MRTLINKFPRQGWPMCAAVLFCAILAGCSSQEQTKSDKSVFGGTGWVEHALMGKVYLLPENTEKLPDFQTLKPVGTLYADKIDIPPRGFEEGFPGVTDRFEWFAVEYQGTFRVRTPGSYDFRVLSDDGAKLYIDGKLLLDNDGTHSPSSVSGKVQLDGSSHSLTLQYFQGPRTDIALQLFYNIEGGTEQIFPGPDIELITPGGQLLPWWVWLILILLLVVLIWFLVSRRRRTEPVPSESETSDPEPPEPEGVKDE